MVFGFFEGGIDIVLDKTAFAFGEAVQGKLNLKLKKEKKARQLRVEVIAVRESKQYSSAPINMIGGSTPKKRPSSQTEILFKTDTVVDGEKLYAPPGREYQFKIQLPSQNVLPPQLKGNLGTAVNVLGALSGQTNRITWFVNAVLDIPGGVDIHKRVQVSVQ